MPNPMPRALSSYAKEWMTTGRIMPLDFSLLAVLATNQPRLFLLQNPDYPLNDKESGLLDDFLHRRSLDEPLAYITGQKEFFGKDFVVTKNTLIPRPETECIVEDVLTTYHSLSLKPAFCLDIGTGSGAIAVTLGAAFSSSTAVWGNDISKNALTIAKENAKIQSSSVQFLLGPFLQPYKKEILTTSPLFIVANLPYVSPELFEQTPACVQNYEPTMALVSEEAGLAHYYQLLSEIKDAKITGFIWLEISPEQTTLLTKHIQNIFPEAEIFVGKDLAGKDRFVRLKISH